MSLFYVKMMHVSMWLAVATAHSLQFRYITTAERALVVQCGVDDRRLLTMNNGAASCLGDRVAPYVESVRDLSTRHQTAVAAWNETFELWQTFFGCETTATGRARHFWHEAHDGAGVLSYTSETSSWTALTESGRALKAQYEENADFVNATRYFLEETCAVWKTRFVGYVQTTLNRVVAPIVTLTRRPGNESVRYTCRAYGFFPDKIRLSWISSDCVPLETKRRGPNGDGTYYAISEIRSKSVAERIGCRVEHEKITQDVYFPQPPCPSKISLLTLMCLAIAGVWLVAFAGILALRKQARDRSY